jgi:hypothetical protein
MNTERYAGEEKAIHEREKNGRSIGKKNVLSRVKKVKVKINTSSFHPSNWHKLKC